MRRVVNAWGRILLGRAPCLSIEITRECPLSCPGCYAFAPNHLGTNAGLRTVADLRGGALIRGALELVDRHRPVEVSLVGGEPLVRHRELTDLLPALASRGIYTQVVTSGVLPLPQAWHETPRLQVVLSVDGLQPEHDARRSPATYDRIRSHVSGHRVTVHWTITRQQAIRSDYLEDFVSYWSAVPEVRHIWVSLYTPQVGEASAERLAHADRQSVLSRLALLRQRYPALKVGPAILGAFAAPPVSPAECVFARTTACFAPDLATRVTPCQLGGQPNCSECGCFAAAAFTAVARHRLPLGIRVGEIFRWSSRIGAVAKMMRGSSDVLRPADPGVADA